MKQVYGDSRSKVIILVGPPGSGKGTQAALISPSLGLPTISTGEMLRRECQTGSALGRSVQAILTSGQLVSDELMNQVISARVRELDCQRGFILDGYPRTVSQARFLNRLLTALSMPRPVVFHFDLSNENVISRLTRRLQCAECGRIFATDSKLIDGDSAEAEMLCDRDGSKLVHRADDNVASVRERLKLYEENAGCLSGYYRKRRYHPVSANRAPQEIANEALDDSSVRFFGGHPARPCASCEPA